MLLIHEKPFEDETLSSFIYRTAKANYMENLGWIFENFQRFASIRLIENEINWLGKDTLNVLADFLNTHHEVIEEMTYTHILTKNKLNYNNIQKNYWFLYSKSRICPLCLAENRYHRKVWGSSFSSICYKHKVLLVDSCNECGSPVSQKAIVVNMCSKCCKPLSEIPTPKLNNDEIVLFQQIIDEGINQDRFSYEHNWIKDFSTFLNAIEFLSLWATQLLDNATFTYKELNIEFDGRVLERNHLKNAKTVEQALCVYFNAFQILNNWPNNFFLFLKKAEKLNKPRFSSLINNIVPTLVKTSLEAINIEVNSYYLNKHYNNINPTDKFIRTNEIKSLNSKFNASILETGHFNIYSIKEENINYELINLRECVEWLNIYGDSLTKNDLMDRWNLSPKATATILNSGLIKGIINYKSGSVSSWVVPLKVVQEFEVELLTKSNYFYKWPISINKAIEWAGPALADYLFEGLFAKKIRFTCKENLPSKIVLAKRDAYFYLYEKIKLQADSTGTISIRDLIFLLGVKRADLLYWISTGRFGFFSVSNDSVIPIENFTFFQKQYITTFELSMLTETPIKTIIKKASIGKLSFVTGPFNNDGKRFLFDRALVKGTASG